MSDRRAGLSSGEVLPKAEPVPTWDQRCRDCGYDLRATDPDGVCPECGLAVAASKAAALTRPRDPKPGAGLVFLVFVWHFVAPLICFGLSGGAFDIRRLDSYATSGGLLNLLLGVLVLAAAVSTFVVVATLLADSTSIRRRRTAVGGVVLATLLAVYYCGGLAWLLGSPVGYGMICLGAIAVVALVAFVQWLVLTGRATPMSGTSAAARVAWAAQWLLIVPTLLFLVPFFGWIAGMLLAPLMTLLTSLLVLGWVAVRWREPDWASVEKPRDDRVRTVGQPGPEIPWWHG